MMLLNLKVKLLFGIKRFFTVTAEGGGGAHRQHFFVSKRKPAEQFYSYEPFKEMGSGSQCLG